MKFLIAGFGSIGRRHFRNLLTLGERDILFLRSGRSTLPDDEIAGYPEETDLDAALEHHPDAVIVATPTALHLEVAIPAADAGCHLFIEKPISDTLARINLLEDSVKKGGSRVFVGFQFRFNPSLIKIRQLLYERSFGKPLSFRVHWGEYLPGWHPWEDYRQGYSARKDLGGGVVLTLCHPLDYIRWMFGDVNSLWAFTANRSDLGLEVEDVAEIGLLLRDGVIGSVHLDYFQRPSSHSLEIICSNGMIRWDNQTGIIEMYDAKCETWKSDPPPIGFERNQMFLSEMKHFLDVIRGNTIPVCDLKDGIKSLELTLAVHKSARDGRIITREK